MRQGNALLNAIPGGGLVLQGLKSTGLGKWLVDDATAGKAKLEAENAPYKAASPVANGVGEVGGQIVATLPLGGVVLYGSNDSTAQQTADKIAALERQRAELIGAIDLRVVDDAPPLLN